MNSLREIKQIDHFGRILYKRQIIWNCNQKTASSFLNFDPKTSESLRLCSDIIKPGPKTFNLHSFLRNVTALTIEKK